MPVLRVRTADGEREIPFTPGHSLLDILSTAGLPVRSGCAGMGVCGLCLVRIEAGEVDPPTGQEIRRFRPEQIRQGDRLACQIIPIRDLTLTIVSPVLPSVWRDIPTDELIHYDAPHTECLGIDSDRPLGIAVDLGTTQIRLTLWNLAKGERLAGSSGLNGQYLFGSDVMTRLMVACESRERAGEIGRLARKGIGEALAGISAREGCRLPEIGRAVIVGNSAMLALLGEKNYEQLLKPAYWASPVDCLPEETASWCDSWGIADHACVEVVQPLAGFVGSDLLAGVLATGLTEQSGVALLIDFGTNSEIALWDGKMLWVTSAAGGPAFEGCGISRGMPAENGAIYRAEPRPAAPGFNCHVLGGGEAKGICGTGLVDVIAGLKRAGLLRINGVFRRDAVVDGQIILDEQSGIAIRRGDVDAFLRAKAAIGAGVLTLLIKAGLRLSDLRRICVCGAFGRLLQPENAQEIGLLPAVPLDRFELCGNSALAGCERLLFSPDSTGILAELKAKTSFINLALVPAFEELFIQQFSIRPLQFG